MACGNRGSLPKPENVKAAYVVLFDISKSTSPTQREQYGDYLRSIWSHIKKDLAASDKPTALIAGMITGDSLADQRKLCEAVDYAHDNLSTEAQDTYDAHIGKLDKLVEAACEKLKTTSTPHTEIVASLDFASSSFAAYPASTRNVLYICSDMQEQSDGADFGDARLTLSDKQIQQLIAKERDTYGLPNLKGVTIVAVGAKAVNSRMYLKIRTFWLDLFKETGAKLTQDDYGPTLRLK